MNWTTPVKPLAPDEMWNVWCNEWSGTFEWMCGPERAKQLLNGGMTSINGEPCRVEVVGHWPHINATQICARTDREPPSRLDWLPKQ